MKLCEDCEHKEVGAVKEPCLECLVKSIYTFYDGDKCNFSPCIAKEKQGVITFYEL